MLTRFLLGSLVLPTIVACGSGDGDEEASFPEHERRGEWVDIEVGDIFTFSLPEDLRLNPEVIGYDTFVSRYERRGLQLTVEHGFWYVGLAPRGGYEEWESHEIDLDDHPATVSTYLEDEGRPLRYAACLDTTIPAVSGWRPECDLVMRIRSASREEREQGVEILRSLRYPFRELITPDQRRVHETTIHLQADGTVSGPDGVLRESGQDWSRSKLPEKLAEIAASMPTQPWVEHRVGRSLPGAWLPVAIAPDAGFADVLGFLKVCVSEGVWIWKFACRNPYGGRLRPYYFCLGRDSLIGTGIMWRDAAGLWKWRIEFDSDDPFESIGDLQLEEHGPGTVWHVLQLGSSLERFSERSASELITHDADLDGIQICVDRRARWSDVLDAFAALEPLQKQHGAFRLSLEPPVRGE